MTCNILFLIGIINGKLYVERQGQQKQRCSRNAACVDTTHNETQQLHHTLMLLRHTQAV